MILTRTSLAEAVRVAERVREITAAAPVAFEGTTIPITLSIGVCCFDGHADVVAEDLLAAADKHLYFAKNNGRNQVKF